MQFTVVTMSRGDEAKIEEWVNFHCALGVTEFFIVLDNPCDDSERVLRNLEVDASIVIDVRPPNGPYYDGMTSSERWRAVLDWRQEWEEDRAKFPTPPNDAISWRQYQYLPPIMASLADRTEPGWVACIDVDEFLVVQDGRRLPDLVADFGQADRLRFLNFNFQTDGHQAGRSVLEQHTLRWSRSDIEAYGKGWDTRVKSLVRYEKAAPMVSVHPISRGPFVVVDPEIAKLHHYRMPSMDIIPHSVEDSSARRVHERLNQAMASDN